jgi:hypothetical protein
MSELKLLAKEVFQRFSDSWKNLRLDFDYRTRLDLLIGNTSGG